MKYRYNFSLKRHICGSLIIFQSSLEHIDGFHVHSQLQNVQTDLKPCHFYTLKAVIIRSKCIASLWKPFSFISPSLLQSTITLWCKMKALHTFTMVARAQNPALQNYISRDWCKNELENSHFSQLSKQNSRTRRGIFSAWKNQWFLRVRCRERGKRKSELKEKNLEKYKKEEACVLSTEHYAVPHSTQVCIPFLSRLPRPPPSLCWWKYERRRVSGVSDHTLLYILMQPQWKKLSRSLSLSVAALSSSVSAPTLGLIASPALEST